MTTAPHNTTNNKWPELLLASYALSGERDILKSSHAVRLLVQASVAALSPVSDDRWEKCFGKLKVFAADHGATVEPAGNDEHPDACIVRLRLTDNTLLRASHVELVLRHVATLDHSSHPTEAKVCRVVTQVTPVEQDWIFWYRRPTADQREDDSKLLLAAHLPKGTVRALLDKQGQDALQRLPELLAPPPTTTTTAATSVSSTVSSIDGLERKTATMGSNNPAGLYEVSALVLDPDNGGLTLSVPSDVFPEVKTRHWQQELLVVVPASTLSTQRPIPPRADRQPDNGASAAAEDHKVREKREVPDDFTSSDPPSGQTECAVDGDDGESSASSWCGAPTPKTPWSHRPRGIFFMGTLVGAAVTAMAVAAAWLFMRVKRS